MKEFTTTVNYDNNEIIFELPEIRKEGEVQPNMTIFQNALFTHVGINEVSGINFLIDSGTEYSAIVQESLSLLEPTQLHFEKPRRSLRKHVGVKLKVVKDFLPQSFIVDGYQVENFRLEVVSALRGKGDKSINRVMTGGSIGKDFLRQFIVTYDFHNMRFDLEPIQMIIEGGKQ
jgi:hypothetical protein